MTAPSYSWLTLHLARFPQALPADATRFAGPAGAAAWRFGPDRPIDADGNRLPEAMVWGGTGFHHSREEAEAVLDGPLPFGGEDAEETWHCALAVIAHRGEVNWAEDGEPHPALTPAGTDPGGLLAVITSAGYLRIDESQMPRIRKFLKAVDEVVAHYRGLEANLMAQLINGNAQREGMTFSLWSGDRAMMTAAYREGTHPAQMQANREEPMFDRSSFTRLRLLRSRGIWDGRDPAAAAAV